MMEEEARRLYERFLRENPQYNVMMPPPMSRPMPPHLGMPMEPQPMPPRPGMPMEPYPMPPRPGMPMEPQPMPPRPMPRRDGMMDPREDIQMQQYEIDYDDRWLRNLIHIMFHNEIYRRRCRNRRCRRWW
jgi:hypothetical protein